MIIITLGAVFLASCGGNDHGELVGVQDRPEFFPNEPYGMVYIPQGSYNMGNSDQDVPYAAISPTKTVAVPPSQVFLRPRQNLVREQAQR